jgi:two-component system, response regulator
MTNYFLQHKTVLLVENNPDDEALTLRAFQLNEFRGSIITARNGTEAVDYLLPSSSDQSTTEHANEPDLVLLDLKLPQMSGFEVLRRLRENQRTKLVPIVVLTSSNEPTDIERSYTLGANSYIQKTIDLTEFISNIRLLVEYWLHTNQPPPKP